MAIDIENYRGQLIQYDEDYDKFICDISIEDKWKKAKRGSLKDVRKEIDAFIKLNAEFKPFKFLMVDGYRGDSFSIKTCSAIRSDGKFVVEDNDGSRYKSYLTVKEMCRARVYDVDVVKKENEMKKIAEDAQIKYRDFVKDLVGTLTPIDLSMYAHISEKKVESLTD